MSEAGGARPEGNRRLRGRVAAQPESRLSGDDAVTHGGRGNTVVVRCRIDAGSTARTLLFEVLDRGSGLGSDQADRLFEPFVRGANGAGPGSGLGLATVASAVRAHGGAFGAANGDGGGARFWFSIPDAEPPTP